MIARKGGGGGGGGDYITEFKSVRNICRAPGKWSGIFVEFLYHFARHRSLWWHDRCGVVSLQPRLKYANAEEFQFPPDGLRASLRTIFNTPLHHLVSLEKRKRGHEENGGRAQEAISVIFWNHADADEKGTKYGGSTSESHHLEVQRSALQGSSYIARVMWPWEIRHQRLQKAAKLLYITTGGRVCANDSRRLWKLGQQQFWNLWIASEFHSPL